MGQTVQKCFKLPCFPPGYKTNGGYKNVNQSQFQPRMKMSQFHPQMQQPVVTHAINIATDANVSSNCSTDANGSLS